MSNKRSSKEKTMPKAKKIPNLADSLPQGSNTMKALTDVQIKAIMSGTKPISDKPKRFAKIREFISNFFLEAYWFTRYNKWSRYVYEAFIYAIIIVSTLFEAFMIDFFSALYTYNILNTRIQNATESVYYQNRLTMWTTVASIVIAAIVIANAVYLFKRWKKFRAEYKHTNRIRRDQNVK